VDVFPYSRQALQLPFSGRISFGERRGNSETSVQFIGGWKFKVWCRRTRRYSSRRDHKVKNVGRKCF
jgi:hypothetical protein